MRKIHLALHWQMILALAVGALAGGLLSGSFGVWGSVVSGIGRAFLNLINMIVIPLVFLSTVLGFASMGGTRSMGRVAAKSFGFFLIIDIVAAFVGVGAARVIRPGKGANPIEIGDIADRIVTEAEKVADQSFMDKLVEIVPSNIFATFSSKDILPIIFFSILFGIFITCIQRHRQQVVLGLFESINAVIIKMTGFIIRLAPIGVFAITMALVGNQAGNMEQLKQCFLGVFFFIMTVWLALLLVGFFVLPPLVTLLGRVSPLRHLSRIKSSLMLAFSTCSSYSAMPLIIDDAQNKFGVSESIAGFTVPLGITFNKIGTIIYECVAVVFVAQASHVDLSIAQQLTIIVASIVTVLGVPSVPMAGMIVLAVLLNAMDLPLSFLGMFMVIDMLCDMPKSLINAYSVSCSAVIVARSEKEKISV